MLLTLVLSIPSFLTFQLTLPFFPCPFPSLKARKTGQKGPRGPTRPTRGQNSQVTAKTAIERKKANKQESQRRKKPPDKPEQPKTGKPKRQNTKRKIAQKKSAIWASSGNFRYLAQSFIPFIFSFFFPFRVAARMNYNQGPASAAQNSNPLWALLALAAQGAQQGMQTPAGNPPTPQTSAGFIPQQPPQQAGLAGFIPPEMGQMPNQWNSGAGHQGAPGHQGPEGYGGGQQGPPGHQAGQTIQGMPKKIPIPTHSDPFFLQNNWHTINGKSPPWYAIILASLAFCLSFP